MKTKQIVMTSAHAIFKIQNVTFPEALIEAWSLFKRNMMAYVMKVNQTVKSKGLGYETVYFDQLNYKSIVTPKISVDYNPAVEKYYGCGIFNND